jgi:signal transduction histidine kinase/DNA-binding NarL/FixJ family response regulator/HPt (histidine-containing phosphotransfer) domain-containing protein
MAVLGLTKLATKLILKIKKIGVIQGGVIYETYKFKYPDLNIIEYASYSAALRALSLSNIDVFVGSLITINYAIISDYIPGLEIIGNSTSFNETGELNHRLGVDINNTILMDILEKGMSAITTQEFRALSEKWLDVSRMKRDIGLSQDEIEWLSEHKILKVASVPNSFPYEIIEDNGSIGGLFGEYLDEIANRLNIEFIWAGNENWQDGIDIIKSGEADLLASVTPTKSRENFLLFSEMIVAYEHAIFARDDQFEITNLDSLDGFTVAQTKGAAVVELLKEGHPEINIIEVERNADALKLVSTGVADAYIGAIATTGTDISNLGYSNIKVVGFSQYELGSAFGVRSDLPLLSSAVNKALADIDFQRRGEISNAWFSLQVDPQTNYTLIWQVIGGSIIAIILILIWNFSLREEVVQRKEIQNRLLKAQDKLEKSTKIAERAQKNAEIANSAKSDFLAAMSHEIRTPLSGIIGLSDLLNDSRLNAKQLDWVNSIHRSGQNLLKILNEILDQSKLNVGMLKLDPADSSTSRKYGGTGLGLSITKQLVELMGGQIGVVSGVNQGSRFWCTLKYYESTGNLKQSEDISSFSQWKEAKHLKVLIAEDNDVNQQLIFSVFDNFNHEVTIASDGQEAISALMKDDFDLILMDIRMPVMDGIETTKAIRAMDCEKANIPIIAITADITAENIREYKGVGIDDVCTKPLDPQTIFKSINKILNERIFLLKDHKNYQVNHEKINQSQLFANDHNQFDFREILNFATKLIDENIDHVNGNGVVIADYMKQDAYVKLLDKFLNNLKMQCKELRLNFDNLVEDPNNDKIIQNMKFVLHTIKGSAGSFGYYAVTETASSAGELLINTDVSQNLNSLSNHIDTLKLLSDKNVIGDGGEAATMLFQGLTDNQKKAM